MIHILDEDVSCEVKALDLRDEIKHALISHDFVVGEVDRCESSGALS